jgi:hypothetical protein
MNSVRDQAICHRVRFLVALPMLLATLAVAELPRVEVVAKRALHHQEQKYAKALAVTLTDANGPRANAEVSLRIATGSPFVRLLDPKGEPADTALSTTDANGIALFGIATGALKPSEKKRTVDFDVLVTVGGESVPKKVQLEVRRLQFSVVYGVSGFQPGRTYPEGVKVTVEDGEDPVTGAEVTLTSLDSPVVLRVPGPGEGSRDVTTKDGTAVFVVDTRDVPPVTPPAAFAFQVTVRIGESTVSGVKTALLGSGYESSFLSDRVSSEVFLGASLARSYDENGKSSGFDESSFVGRLRVDTLWTQKSKAAFHTGIELQFSSFPTTEVVPPGGARAEPPPSITSYADTFSGSVVLIYQPPWKWATHYSETSRNKRPELRHDALRVGAVLRAGLASRDAKRTPDGDTDLRFLRAGLIMTHHQTHAGSPEEDDVNVFPMRYVEISYGRFEQIFDQRDADRLVVEAGLRLPGLGNDTVPFYAGLYVNAGHGQDDIRVFAGLLFHINKIVELFQK